MKKSKIKLLPPPTPTSTQILSPTSRAGNDYLNFWSELKKKPPTSPQPQPRPFVPKSHSLTDYDGINEFFQGIKTPQKSNPLLFFLFITLLIL
jgi:hypothetical protein